MMIAFNPRDPNTFASASMNNTVKVWTIQNSKPNFTLTGHESVIIFNMEINLIQYEVEMIDLLKYGIIKLNNVYIHQKHINKIYHQLNFILIYHLLFYNFNIILQLLKMGSLGFWHSNTQKLKISLNYNMERVWNLNIGKDYTLEFAFDKGAVVVKIGQDEPIVSMQQGKVVLNSLLLILKLLIIHQMMNKLYKHILKNQELVIYISCGVRHSINGHLFAIFSDSEYTIYRSNLLKYSKKILKL